MNEEEAMTTLNISLPDSMRNFIEEQISQGTYSTASEYIRQLVREDQKRAQHEKLEALLLEGLDSGVPAEATEEWWKQKWIRLQEKLSKVPSGKN
jgi:antitoxin ParD1/3/4